MRFGIHTLDDFDIAGKTVLCRVDINQPIDRRTGALKSTARIEACAATVGELSGKGAKVVLLAHQGSDIEYANFYTTRPHASVLARLLGRPVAFIDDVCGPAARDAIRALGEGDILLLDNVRFCAEEQTLFEWKLELSHERQACTEVVRKLAPLGDLYVCDAFAAAHRDQPTLCGFEQVLPSAMGRLFEKEYCVLSKLMESPARPCTFVLGGAKIADAFLMMEAVLDRGVADRVLTGGLVANLFLLGGGVCIGRESLRVIEDAGYGAYIEKARALLARFGDRIALPRDIAALEEGARRETGVGESPADACVMDIGHITAQAYSDFIRRSGTVFVNGPMGVFEREEMELGTRVVWDALGKTSAYTVIGGGDSIAATVKYQKTAAVSYLCTGGGAMIRFLTGEELPVVRALRGAGKNSFRGKV